MLPNLSILAQPTEIWVFAGFVVAFVALYRLLRGAAVRPGRGRPGRGRSTLLGLSQGRDRRRGRGA